MEGVESVEERKLREGNIALILEHYDDIFSDFDPRPYGEKALSDDFLSECRKAARDKESHGLELRIMVPRHHRDEVTEEVIKHRLKGHFTKHFHEKEHEIRTVRRRGFQWFGLGIVCMFVAAYLYGLEGSGFLYNLLIVMFEPAAWFLFWEGLDQVFFETKQKQPEHEFYQKMAHVTIEFFGY